jgi:hypothetical protein
MPRGGGQLADRGLAPAQPLQHGATGGVGQGLEDGVEVGAGSWELLCELINHMVK